MLENKADPNVKDPYGNSPLVSLVKNGKYPEAVLLLLDYTNEINDVYRTAWGGNLLHYACNPFRIVNYKVIKRLLEKKVNVNLRNRDGETALHIATMGLDIDSKVINILLEHGASLEMPDGKGKTPLHYICENCISIDNQSFKSILTKTNNVNTVCVLYGINVTPLETLCKTIEKISENRTKDPYQEVKDSIEKVVCLIEKNADTRMLSLISKRTLLWLCMSFVHTPLFIELLMKGTWENIESHFKYSGDNYFNSDPELDGKYWSNHFANIYNDYLGLKIWSRERHCIFNQHVKGKIYSLLLSFKVLHRKMGIKLPRPLQEMIFQKVVYSSYENKNNPKKRKIANIL